MWKLAFEAFSIKSTMIVDAVADIIVSKRVKNFMNRAFAAVTSLNVPSFIFFTFYTLFIHFIEVGCLWGTDTSPIRFWVFKSLFAILALLGFLIPGLRRFASNAWFFHIVRFINWALALSCICVILCLRGTNNTYFTMTIPNFFLNRTRSTLLSEIFKRKLIGTVTLIT